MREVQVIRDFVGTPQNILGSVATKHGEIAEQVNVGIARAREVLLGNTPTSTFEGVGRLAPTDYIRDGVGVQAKYYNGLQNTLRGIAEHAERYTGFSSGKGVYDIPSDQHAQIRQLNQNGSIEGLSQSKSDAIRRSIDALEQRTGRPAGELLQRGESSYPEVQQGRVHDTIRDREGELNRQNDRLKDTARAEHGTSLSGLGKAAGIGAAVAGSLTLAQGTWVKYREGKNPFKGEFTLTDWRDVGMPAVQSAGVGAIAGGGVYLLTNSTKLAAPAAGSLVSGLMGVGSLLGQYHAGEISGDEFVDMSQMVVLDTAIVGLASMTGQILIPVPVVGALIGSLAGKHVASAISGALGDEEARLIAQLNAYESYALEQLDDAYHAQVRRLDAHFSNLERLAEFAFDSNVNLDLRLNISVRFAQRVGVPDDLILRSTEDLDRFMTE